MLLELHSTYVRYFPLILFLLYLVNLLFKFENVTRNILRKLVGCELENRISKNFANSWSNHTVKNNFSNLNYFTF